MHWLHCGHAKVAATPVVWSVSLEQKAWLPEESLTAYVGHPPKGPVHDAVLLHAGRDVVGAAVPVLDGGPTTGSVGKAAPGVGEPAPGVGASTGASIGGHLISATVFTTAEIVLGEVPCITFDRQFDDATGFKELVVVRRQDVNNILRPAVAGVALIALGIALGRSSSRR